MMIYKDNSQMMMYVYLQFSKTNNQMLGSKCQINILIQKIQTV